MNTALRFFFYLALAYGVLVMVVFLLQRRMIYFPEGQHPSVQTLDTLGMTFWPDGGQGYRGLVSVHPQPRSRGTVVVFHGNAGSAWQRDYYLWALEPLGYKVVLAEYPGYAGRGGAINERTIIEDAVQTIKSAQAEFGPPVFLLGESMGSGVAAAATACPEISTAGLILITPWDSLPDLAQSLYWYLPARLMTLDRFDSLKNLHAYTRPVAVAVAENDEVIPGRHSMRLYNSLTSAKRLWRFKGAGHNSWPNRPDATWWREAMAFVETAKEPDRSPTPPSGAGQSSY